VLFDDIDTKALKVADWTNIRQQHISMLFQELRLFPELTAMENVLIKNNLTGYKTREEITSWFEMLGIPDKQDVKIGRMSFGQQQRVALMRSLVQPFDFLVADEPVSHLDDQNASIMGDIMMQEVRRQGAGLIVTSIGKHMDLNYDKVVQL
jgi:ABC-type lipoprotein export system ATPase subunit